MQNTLPSFSVIIEWENARLSELARARAMLSALATQVRAISDRLDAPPELIVLHDPAAIDPALVEQLLDETFAGQDDISRRLMPCEKGTYYRQKNHGASIANRSLVMFLDSDVIPEPDWLETLIGSFADGDLEVVCGNTYIDTQSLYSRAFALFWFFPLRSRSPGLLPSSYFFANNVVFRRDLFLSYGFPELPYLRGQCTALAHQLTKDGHRIFINTGARVSHPPPNGAVHFVKRALCEGHDQAHKARDAGQKAFPLGALGRYRRNVVASATRIWRDRREIDLGTLGAIGATAIAAAYYTICLSGEAVTALRPSFIREHLAV